MKSLKILSKLSSFNLKSSHRRGMSICRTMKLQLI